MQVEHNLKMILGTEHERKQELRHLAQDDGAP